MEWKFADFGGTDIDRYQKKLNISSQLAIVFANRNVDINTAEKLIYRTYDIVRDPVPIKGIDAAVSFLLKNISEKRDIHIFADYDCDGLTSGYIMNTFLNNFEGIRSEVYYPERIEKYGLSKLYCMNLINRYELRDLKPLVVTVDNGITKKEEVKLLRDNGFPVLITDHHLIDKAQLPEDCIILDPYLGSNGRNLCGAGVAWNLCRAVEDKIGADHSLTDYLLYAAAIGTLADVMPLDTYNVALTTLGLSVMNSDQAPKNIQVFRRLFCSNEIVDSDAVSWTLAPMLNACGRMGDVHLGANFFFETDEDALLLILEAIKKMNDERKNVEKDALEELEDYVDTNKEVICVVGNSYPVGIHGLLAGKISQKYDKPAIVMKSVANEDLYIGSSRSNTVPLNILLKKEKERGHILSYGGHAFAGGVSLAQETLDDLIVSLDEQVRQMKEDGTYDQYLKEPALIIDDSLPLRDINNTLRDELNAFAYDKKTFAAPIWAFMDLTVEAVSSSKNNPDNLKFTISDGTHTMDIWGWNIRERYEEIGSPKEIDIAGQLVVNFMRPKYTTIRIVDIREAE